MLRSARPGVPSHWLRRVRSLGLDIEATRLSTLWRQFIELRQVIAYVEPRGFGGHVNVTGYAYIWGMIESSSANVHVGWTHVTEVAHG